MSVEIIKKTVPTLEERGLSMKEVLQQAQKIDNDEFYTRYEDVEKELDTIFTNFFIGSILLRK